MAVFRVERTSDYTVMSNYHLRGQTPQLEGQGLLSQMLSLPEDWDYTLAGLCYINRESKDAIRTAIHELERAGYIHRRQTTEQRRQVCRQCIHDLRAPAGVAVGGTVIGETVVGKSDNGKTDAGKANTNKI